MTAWLSDTQLELKLAKLRDETKKNNKKNAYLNSICCCSSSNIALSLFRVIYFPFCSLTDSRWRKYEEDDDDVVFDICFSTTVKGSDRYLRKQQQLLQAADAAIVERAHAGVCERTEKKV